MHPAWLVTLVACKFTPGELATGDGGGPDIADSTLATSDGNADSNGGPTACVQSWLSVAGPSFITSVRLATLASATSDGDVFVSRDGLRMYFARSGDIWFAARASTSDPWPAPSVEADLSSPASDTKLSFTDDELTVFINSSRQGSTSDVWRGTRAAIGDAWTWDRTHLAAVNGTGDSQWDPHISGDGLSIYFAPSGGGLGAQLLWVATRSSTTTNFGTAQRVSVNGTVTDNDPTVTLDDRVIIWASNRTGDRGLWYATRAEPTDPWGLPRELASVNTTSSDDGPHVSADGCELYFTSDRPGGAGGDDLYVARMN